MNDRQNLPQGGATINGSCTLLETPEIRHGDGNRPWCGVRAGYGEPQDYGKHKGETFDRYIKLQFNGEKAARLQMTATEGSTIWFAGRPYAKGWAGNKGPMADLMVSVDSFAVVSGVTAPPRAERKPPSPRGSGGPGPIVVADEADIPFAPCL
jgi:hypothetical protein